MNLAHMQNKDDNKQIKDNTKWLWWYNGEIQTGGHMCTKLSAVQFGGQDKPWTSMAGALVEQQLMFVSFKTKSQ